MLLVVTHGMKNPRIPNHSPGETEQEIQDLQDSIRGLPQRVADAKICEHEQLTADRFRNQLSALRNAQGKPQNNAFVINA
jgi:hypothetical protein